MPKIAIPLFDERIAPRFDCARSFLLVQIDDGGIVGIEELQTEQMSGMESAEKLRQLRVDTLICGGIDNLSAHRLIKSGIRIYAWITGRAKDAMIAFLNGDLESGIMVGNAGRRQGRWNLRRRGAHFGKGGRKTGRDYTRSTNQ